MPPADVLDGVLRHCAAGFGTEHLFLYAQRLYDTWETGYIVFYTDRRSRKAPFWGNVDAVAV
ncbi:hypothetical protein SDC9_170797 [bioreactor metagenome]|uniref:Uncharacterized protein n=1 Tax=bioreactor metagenome TaxID=1076179 RepID=A0A645GC94_9ZZZZ